MSDAGREPHEQEEDAGREAPPPPAGWAELFGDEPEEAGAAWAELVARKPWKASRLASVFLEQARGDLKSRGGWTPRPGRPRVVQSKGGKVVNDVPPFLRRPEGGPRDAVVGCRVDAAELEAIDLLVEAGIRGTRSEAAAWFIREGIKAHQGLLDDTRATVAEIRRLREQAQAKARERTGEPSNETLGDSTAGTPPKTEG
jgi:hypothetical protein